MSQIDVRKAKTALAIRLRDWGVQGDAGQLAAGFIDDLVEQGWQIAAFRETRPQPPGVHEACHNCGREYRPNCCDNPTQKPAPTTDYAARAAEARARLHTDTRAPDGEMEETNR